MSIETRSAARRTGRHSTSMHERNCTVLYTLKNLLGYHPLSDSVESDVFLQVCSHLVHLSESEHGTLGQSRIWYRSQQSWATTHTGGEIGAVGRVRQADVRLQLQIQLNFHVSE